MHLATCILLLLTIVWGSTFPIIQMALTDVKPLTLLLLRFALAVLFLLPLTLFTNTWKLKEKKSALVCGCLLFGGFAFQTFGLQKTTSTRAAFITGLCVVFVPIFESIFFKTKQSWNIWCGVVASFFGLVLLSFSHSGNAPLEKFSFHVNNVLSRQTLVGDFLVLGCAVLFGLHILFMSHYSKKENSLALASWQLCIVVPVGFVFLLFQQNTHFQWPSHFSILAIIYLALIATAFATVAQLWAQKKLSASQAALVISLEPVFASLFSSYFLKEKLSLLGMLGCVLMLFGCLFASLFPQPKSNFSGPLETSIN
jgi:drug/metabolite transporter (DMT)-like permease